MTATVRVHKVTHSNCQWIYDLPLFHCEVPNDILFLRDVINTVVSVIITISVYKNLVHMTNLLY